MIPLPGPCTDCRACSGAWVRLGLIPVGDDWRDPFNHVMARQTLSPVYL
jgi:hypothetical protein